MKTKRHTTRNTEGILTGILKGIKGMLTKMIKGMPKGVLQIHVNFALSLLVTCRPSCKKKQYKAQVGCFKTLICWKTS